MKYTPCRHQRSLRGEVDESVVSALLMDEKVGLAALCVGIEGLPLVLALWHLNVLLE